MILWLGARGDSLASRVTSLEQVKRGKNVESGSSFVITFSVFEVRTFFSLADDERQSISRATVRYPPLYRNPPFLAALGHFREAERRSIDATDLFQRGADRVVHNAGLYDSRRSSTQEDRPELVEEAGPSNHPEEAGDQRVTSPGRSPPVSPTQQGRQN